MRYFILFVVSLLILSCQNGTTKKDGFVIKGELKGVGNRPIRISYRDSSNQVGWTNDTVYANNDKFTLTGKVKDASFAYIYIEDSTLSIYMPSGYRYKALPITFYLSNDEITVEAPYDEPLAARLSGNEYNEGRSKYSEMTSVFNVEANAILRKTVYMEDGEEKKALMARREMLYDKADSMKQVYISQNSDNVYTAYLVSSMVSRLSLEKIEKYYNAFTDHVKASRYGARIGKKIQGAKESAMNQPAIEFALTDKDGNQVKLADYKGKVVLLDFWGSWCNPCRSTHPHLRHLYQENKDKGFEIIGIAQDSNEKKWLQAIEDDQMDWIQINGTSHQKEMDLFAGYYVNAFPTKILIDKEGRIAFRLIGAGEERAKILDEKVAELLAQ